MRTTSPEKGAALLCKGGTARSVESQPDTESSQPKEATSIALLGFPPTLSKVDISLLEECLTAAFEDLERRTA